jgi:hypothetical protein
MENRSLPKNIDYSDVLPQSVPAIQRRRKFYPANGATFSNKSNKQIRIEVSSANALLDPLNSYIEFDVRNNNGAITFGADIGGGAIFFDTLTIEQGGRVLSKCQEYNKLNSKILAMSQEQLGGKLQDSIKGLTRANNGNAISTVAAPGSDVTTYGLSQHNSVAVMGFGDKIKFSMPVISGLFTQDKLIPLPMVAKNSPITIVLDIAVQENCGVFSANPGAIDIFEISNITYVASLIEVGGDVLNQFTMMRDEMMGGQLAISGQDWEHNSGSIAAGETGEIPIRVPARKRSLKSLFFTASSDTFNSQALGTARWDVYNLSFCGTGEIQQYQAKVGSVVYPAEPVICGALTNTNAEQFMELCKAFGSLGFNKPGGHHNVVTFGGSVIGANLLNNGDIETNIGGGAVLGPQSTDVLNMVPFGLDLDAFQHTAIEGGIDTKTLAEEVNLLIRVAAGNVEAKIIDVWALYDQHYYFGKDGMITFSN